jgi:hypothetical protein
VPDVRRHYLKVADRHTDVLLEDPERGSEPLSEVLGERIRLSPDESGVPSGVPAGRRLQCVEST